MNISNKHLCIALDCSVTENFLNCGLKRVFSSEEQSAMSQ